MLARIPKIVVLSLVATSVCGSAAFGNALTNVVKSASSAALPAAENAAEQSALGSLTKSVPGLSQAQGALGAGSLFGLAKGKMSAAQFSQIEKAIPGVDHLVQEATKKGLPKPLKSYADVDSFLVKTGMTSTQVGQLATSLEKTVGGLVPASVSSAFSAALQHDVPAGGRVAADSTAAAPTQGMAKRSATGGRPTNAGVR